MNKKQLLIAAMAAALSVSGVDASSITGISQSGNTFNITPDQIQGSVGYRKYTDFTLDDGHIANLIYYGTKNGAGRNLEAFVNLVQNKVNINGVLNTVDQSGAFSSGHAIFITPSGLSIGPNGVLNVGALSVATPTTEKYNSLVDDYAFGNFDNINQISKLKQDSNADISVNGLIIARRGVDLRGKSVDINSNGKILNGINNSQTFTSRTNAETLFTNLVNTDGSFKSGTSMVSNGSTILIKADDKAGGGIEIMEGQIINNDNGGTYLTNKGDYGISLEGAVISDRTAVTINNQDGNLIFSAGTPNYINSNNISVVNYGKNFTMSATNLNGTNKVDLVNHGNGTMSINATIDSRDIDIVNNNNAEALSVSGTIGGSSSTSTRIMNRGGSASVDANITSTDVLISNKSSDGLSVGGSLKGKTISVNNSGGNLTINGTLENTGSTTSISVYNDSNGDSLTLSSTGQIKASGELAIKNMGDDGMTLNGSITNTGTETAINNTAGALIVDGSITNSGNMGIKNSGSGLGTGADLTFTKNANITNNGSFNIRNSGDNGMTIAGTINNTGASSTHTDNLHIVNESGKLQFIKDSTAAKGASVSNTNGNLYIAGTKESEGILAASGTTISNANGDLAIRNKGQGVLSGINGLDLQGSITNNGTALAINNNSGNMYVGGSVTASNGNLGIINRAGGGSMILGNDSVVTTASQKTANIKNYGSGNMTVNSTINNNGRTNVIANSGSLELGGRLNNTSGTLGSSGGFYAASRANGTGINVTSAFVADNSTGEILIKNISGNNGLTYNGTITNGNYQTALVNKQGSLNVGGDISGSGSVILSNAGNELNVTSSSALSSTSEVKVVNTGTTNATLEGNITAPNGRILYEQLKK